MQKFGFLKHYILSFVDKMRNLPHYLKQILVNIDFDHTFVWQVLSGACFSFVLSWLVVTFTDMMLVYTMKQRIFLVGVALAKIDKNLGGPLDLLTSNVY